MPATLAERLASGLACAPRASHGQAAACAFRPAISSPGAPSRRSRAASFSGASPAGRRQLRLAVVAQASGTQTLPIFPLSTVALPGVELPLQIFEARYRVLFSTLLAGSEGIEEGLVSPGKPWEGTRRFGMCFYDPQSKALASIGTVLEIKQHTRLDDGRLLISSIGRERFRIKDVLEERPVLVCGVEMLPEDEDASEEVAARAREVADAFRSVVRLSVKLRDAKAPDGLQDPEQLSGLAPCALSYWVASLFAGNPYSQQAVLEEDSTLARLQQVGEVLEGSLKFLSAQSALQGAFSKGGSVDDPPVPPTGGPD